MIGLAVVRDLPDAVQLVCQGGLLSVVLDKGADLFNAFQVTGLEAARVVQNKILVLSWKGHRLPNPLPLRPDSPVANSRLFPRVSRIRVLR